MSMRVGIDVFSMVYGGAARRRAVPGWNWSLKPERAALNSEVQRFLLTFPDAFEPVGEHIDLSGMAPYKTALSTVDGVTYSMPFDSGVAGLFYRSADLEEAGLDASALQNITWAEFVDVAKQKQIVLVVRNILYLPFVIVVVIVFV